MPSDAAVLLAKDLLNQILLNISAGIHPVDPAPRESLLEYFYRERYSRIIQPAIAKKWEETDMYLQEKNRDQDPPLEFCREVTKGLFEELSNEEREQLSSDLDRDLLLVEDNHKIAIQRMYGGVHNDDGGLAQAVHGVLRSTMIALEALTGMNFLLWVGESQPGHRTRLVQATSRSSTSEETFIVPHSNLNFYTQQTRIIMQNIHDNFLHQCAKSPTLPSHLFYHYDTTAQPSGDLLLPESHATPSNIPIGSDTTPAQPRLSISREPPIRESSAPDLDNDRSIQKRKHGITLESPGPFSASPPSKRQRFLKSGPDPLSSVSSPESPKELRMRLSSNSRNPTNSYLTALTFGSASDGPVLQGLESKPRGSTAASPASSMTRHSSGAITPPSHRLASTSRLATPPFQKMALTVTPLSESNRKSLGLPKYFSIKDLLATIPESGKWLFHALNSISQTHLGAAYYDLVKLLITLEALHGYTNRRGAPPFSHVKRPKEVTVWIKTGRKRQSIDAEVEDVQAYAPTWWEWWISLQPGWRRFDKMGMPLHVLPAGNTPDWACLLLPGANGFLGVVASLYFWGCAERRQKGKEKDNGNGWEKAVEDCMWVMENLVSTLKERGGIEED